MSIVTQGYGHEAPITQGYGEYTYGYVIGTITFTLANRTGAAFSNYTQRNLNRETIATGILRTSRYAWTKRPGGLVLGVFWQR